MSIALGFDRPCYGYSGDVTVAQLVQAVNNALDGCPGVLGVFDQSDRTACSCRPGRWRRGSTCRPAPIPTRSWSTSTAWMSPTSAVHDGPVDGDLIVAPGSHQLIAFATVDGTKRTARSQFEAVALTNPDECEVLNNAECLLPYPSSRFLVDGPEHGDRLPPATFPPAACRSATGPPLSPPTRSTSSTASARWCRSSCTSRRASTSSASDASRLLPPGCCGQPAGPPWIDTRTSTDARSTPTARRCCIDADTGERVLHWLELDAHADGNPARQALIMRPGISLIPGHRYIVAMRNLKTGGRRATSSPSRPSRRCATIGRRTIDAIESRRATDGRRCSPSCRRTASPATISCSPSTSSCRASSSSPARCCRCAIRRSRGSTSVEADAGREDVHRHQGHDHDCTAPGRGRVARRRAARSRARSSSPAIRTSRGVGVLESGRRRRAAAERLHRCAASPSRSRAACSPRTRPSAHPIVLGHGLFGAGRDMTSFVPGLAGAVEPWTYVAGATDWRGLVRPRPRLGRQRHRRRRHEPAEQLRRAARPPAPGHAQHAGARRA